MRNLVFAATVAVASATALAATCPTVPVTFKITDPAAAANQAVYVNGDQAALGKWTPTDANQATREGQTNAWSATLQLPPDTNFQFKFFKRVGDAGAEEVWESDFTSFTGNREARTPACGTEGFILDGGVFRQAEWERNPFTDDLAEPKGKKAERIKALIAAFNANKPEAVREFIAKHTAPAFVRGVPPGAYEQAFADRYQRTQGMDLRGIRTYKYAQPETTVLLQNRVYGAWLIVSVAFEEGAEERITGIVLQTAKPPKLPPLTEAAFVADVRAAIARGCKANVFSGTALVARRVGSDNKVLLEMACGDASKRYHVPNNIDTKFNLGSMNKMFTSVAISQLVERGKLKYTDTIDRYVDATWLPGEITRQITVHHLLSHTSGLGSYFNDKYWNSSRLLFRQLDDYKPLVAGDKLEFKPGERYAYSNTGMLLLGVVIEKVSGQNYFDFVRDNVFKPAGMTNTDSFAIDDPVENLAAGYIPAPDRPLKWIDNTLLHVLRGGPAGGGYSTVRDLNKFVVALQSGKLLKPESLQRHWTDQSKAGYGYGFQVTNTPNGKLVGHGGGFPGLNGQLDVYLDKGMTIAVLANHDGAANPLATRIGQMLERVK